MALDIHGGAVMTAPGYEKTEDLRAIKKRLRANKLTPEDLKKLETFIFEVERASKALRAAVIE
jgi:hypothetical protein